jgi:hypothetical protein
MPAGRASESFTRSKTPQRPYSSPKAGGPTPPARPIALADVLPLRRTVPPGADRVL